MQNKIGLIALLATLVGAGVASAQDQNADLPTETTGAEAPTAPAEEAKPQETIEAVHGDWQIRCGAANGECYMYQLALDALEVPVAEVSMVAIKDREKVKAGFTIVTPLRTLLTEGLVMQIDNGQVQKYRYSWCTEAGCFARFGVTENGLGAFKRGNKARLTVISVERPTSPVILDVSLKGFTAAYNDLVTR